MSNETQIKFLKRLGAREIWGMSFFWFTAGGYALTAFAYDAIRTSNFDLNWAAIALGTFFEVVFLAWLLIKLFPAKRWGTSALLAFNLVIVFLLGAIKNVSVALIAQELKLDSNIDWGLRFWGGGLLSLSLLVFFVMTLGSWVEHKAVMTKLELMRAGLDAQRGNATSVVTATELRLTQEATATIFPVLSQIKTLLSDKASVLQAVEILKDTIENKVRPLSQDFHQRATTLASSSIFDANVNLKVSRFPRTYALSKSIMPLSNLLGMIAGIGSVAYMLQGVAAGWSAFAASLPTLIVFGAAKLFTAKLKPTSSWLNAAIISLLSLATSYLDLFAYQLLNPNYQHKDLMDVTVFASAFLLAFGTTYYRTLELNRFAIEARMLQLNLELKRELAMFEQQVVATSKRWSYTLHGTVQPALVAAITRLSTADEHSTKLVSEVLSDLERIEQAIQKPGNAEIDINQEFKELGSSWKDICEIEIALSKEAEAKLNTSATTKFCLIEIAKEAVSNAYRHGLASNVWISIHATAHDSIELIVRNNGKYRAKKAAQKSLGTKMLDEMATEWSIRYLPDEKLTLLRALVPLSKS